MALVRDVTYAVRALSRAPSFTIPAAVSLALGIALNTTLFGIFSALLLRPVGHEPAGELVRIGRSQNNDGSFRSASYDEYLYLRTHSRTLGAIAGHQLESIILTGPRGAKVMSAEAVTHDYFEIVGAMPATGRVFTAADERVPVAVISHGMWERDFGRDPGVAGRALTLGGRSYTIIGVAPAGFAGTFQGIAIDLWLPVLASNSAAGREPQAAASLMLIGRLTRGASIRTLRTELDVLKRQLADAHPDRQRGRGFSAEQARGLIPLFGRVVRPFLAMLMAGVAVVLLIACANVTSLLLARARARRAEIAVRLACGASRRQLIALLLVESLVLAALGSAAGLALSFAALRILNTIALANGPTGSPLSFDLRVDARVLLFTVAATLLTAVIVGLVPALQATRTDLISSLKGTDSPARRSRLRGALMVFQVAVSCVLLVAAGLLVRSLHYATSLDVGFAPDRVVIVSFELRALGYDTARRTAFYQELLTRARGIPGIEQAAWADFIPLADSGGTFTAANPDPSGGDRVTVPYGVASPGYFATVGHPLVRGRDFRESDRTGSPLVMIVNEALARRFFPGQDALGRHLTFTGEEERVFEIVGVIKDARFQSLQNDIGPLAILPAAQQPSPIFMLHARTASPAAEIAASIRRVSTAVDPNVAVDAEGMRDRMGFGLIPLTVARIVFGVAGLIALLLAAGGLYGLVAYGLSQRVKEIGIRTALGATRASLFRLLVGRVFALAATGIAIGLAMSAAASQLLRSLLYGLSPTDPATFAGVAGLLLLTVLAAGYCAVRGALQLTALSALRHEER